MDYLKAFLVGGLLCVIGQILIDRTKLTPARILVAYVVAGVLLGAVGLYDKLVDFAGAGATVPLTGFGNTLARGVKKAVDEDGALGILTGGLTAVAKTGYRTPPEAQVFHRTIPRTAVSKVGLGDKYHAPQRVDAAVTAQRPLGGKRAVKIVLA